MVVRELVYRMICLWGPFEFDEWVVGGIHVSNENLMLSLVAIENLPHFYDNRWGGSLHIYIYIHIYTCHLRTHHTYIYTHIYIRGHRRVWHINFVKNIINF